MADEDDYEFDDSAFSAEEWFYFGLDNEEYRKKLIDDEKRREEYEETKTEYKGKTPPADESDPFPEDIPF